MTRPRKPRGSTRSVLVALFLAALLVGGAIVGGSLLRDDDQPSGVAAATGERVVATTAPTTAPAPTTTTSPPRRGNGQPVTIAFGGDVHFEGALGSKLASDPTGMLATIAPVLSSADVAMVNLETAITERGTPVAKEYTFRAPPASLEALRAAGVDVTTVANNHGIDYGPDGLEDTLLAELATGFPVIGVGSDASQAYEPFRVDVRGQRIGIIAASDVIDDFLISEWSAGDAQPGIASAKDTDRLVAAVAAARPTLDTLVVFLHWGVERQTCPSERQRALADALVWAGADVVVGSHAHVLQGAGRLGAAFVAYGLGNFVFYNESGPAGVSGVLEVTVTGRDVDAYRWIPARIQGGVPVPLEGEAAAADVAAWDALRACTNLTP